MQQLSHAGSIGIVSNKHDPKGYYPLALPGQTGSAMRGWGKTTSHWSYISVGAVFGEQIKIHAHLFSVSFSESRSPQEPSLPSARRKGRVSALPHGETEHFMGQLLTQETSWAST